MVSLHKNIQLMLEFLKAPFFVVHFSYYILMTFLMMLFVILLSMLMILLTTLSVIRHLNLNMTNVDWGRKLLVDFSAGKTQSVLFDWSNNTGAIDVKMDGSVLEENSSFKILELTFSSKLDWGFYIISIVKTASKKIGALICSVKFLWRSCMESCCHVWAGAHSCYLELLDKLQKQICRTTGPSLAAYLEPCALCWNPASLSLFYRCYFGRCSSELAQLVTLSYFRRSSTHYSNRLHDFHG